MNHRGGDQPELVGVAWLDVAFLVEPLADEVLLREIVLRGGLDAFRPDQPVCLPVEAALDHPA